MLKISTANSRRLFLIWTLWIGFFVQSTLGFTQSIQCETLSELIRAYLLSHVAKRTMTPEIQKGTVENYLQSLDPSKNLILESDAELVRKDLSNIFVTMKAGSCVGLEKVHTLIVSRAIESENMVRKILDKDYKLDNTAEIITDFKKRTFPKSLEEKEALVRKHVHFQMANYLVSDMKPEEAKKNLIHRYELLVKRLKEKKMTDHLNTFVDSFSSSLDPHSSYFSPDALEDFRISMGLSLEGIGASLSSQDGYTVVEEIIPGGAADRAKILKNKDKIISVAQETGDFVNVIDMDLKEVVKLIRGKKGSKVRLNILRATGDKTERLEVTLVRDKVSLEESAAKIRYETHKRGNKTYNFGIIDLPSFYGDSDRNKRSSYEDIKKLLVQATQKKVDGLILNLARNGGGLLDDAYKIGGLFIRTGPIVATRNTKGEVELLTDNDESLLYSGPLLILTSRVSASASEILAGALQDYGRALVVGADHTFGKGTVQAVIPLPRNLGAMKVTTGMFFLPGGASTQHQGVKGSITIPYSFNIDDIGEKSLDYSLPPQRIPSFLSRTSNYENGPLSWKPVDQALLKFLEENSKKRVAKDPKFAETLKELEEAKSNKGIIKVSDIKGDSTDKKKKNEEKKSFAERIKDADAPYVNEAINILGDMIEKQGKRG